MCAQQSKTHAPGAIFQWTDIVAIIIIKSELIKKGMYIWNDIAMCMSFKINNVYKKRKNTLFFWRKKMVRKENRCNFSSQIFLFYFTWLLSKRVVSVECMPSHGI